MLKFSSFFHSSSLLSLNNSMLKPLGRAEQRRCPVMARRDMLKARKSKWMPSPSTLGMARKGRWPSDRCVGLTG